MSEEFETIPPYKSKSIDKTRSPVVMALNLPQQIHFEISKFTGIAFPLNESLSMSSPSSRSHILLAYKALFETNPKHNPIHLRPKEKWSLAFFLLLLCQRRICFEQLLRYALPERPTIVFLQLAGECEQVILLFFLIAPGNPVEGKMTNSWIY